MAPGAVGRTVWGRQDARRHPAAYFGRRVLGTARLPVRLLARDDSLCTAAERAVRTIGIGPARRRRLQPAAGTTLLERTIRIRDRYASERSPDVYRGGARARARPSHHLCFFASCYHSWSPVRDCVSACTRNAAARHENAARAVRTAR